MYKFANGKVKDQVANIEFISRNTIESKDLGLYFCIVPSISRCIFASLILRKNRKKQHFFEFKKEVLQNQAIGVVEIVERVTIVDGAVV